MTRARRSSIVSSIASRTGGLDYLELPSLLDDSYLFNKLEKLALVVGEDSKESFTLEKTSAVDESFKIRNEKKYRQYENYLGQLESHVQRYEMVLKQSYKVHVQIEHAIQTFNSISSNSNDFVNKTKNLYEENHQLSALHKKIPAIMQYFTALDPIMRRLNHASSSNVVRKNSFGNMLISIDQSLFFFEEHPELEEAELYRIKFKRCLIRACELVSNYLNGILRQTYNDISEKMTSSTSSSTASREALVYNKFEQTAEEYNSRVVEIISRVYNDKFQRYSDELGSILNDCYEQYFQTRLKLLGPMIHQRLDEIITANKGLPLVNFIEDAKSQFSQLCIDEHNLFVKFFGSEHSRSKSSQWLCRLCEPLYDAIRTRILRETDISMLCDAVTLFGQYYQFEENSEEYQLQFQDIQFDKIFEPIVQKLQARLILRVQIYIQQNVVNYSPSKDSFIISHRRKKPEAPETTEKNDDAIYLAYVANIDQHSTEEGNYMTRDKLELYYPPLISSLALLSKIYEMLNVSVFNDLAHHIVHDCICSLRKAYDIVNSSPGGANNLDIKLSYLGNLLLLRQEIQNFNIQYTVSETYLDFSGVETLLRSFAGSAKGLQNQDKSMLGMAKALVPKVVKNMVDARSELLIELRNLIKDFTEVVTAQILGSSLDISTTGESDTLLSRNIKLRQNLEEKLPRTYSQIMIFINDSEIAAHLMIAIQESITQCYNVFYEQVSDKAETGELDKSEVSELMYDDVFADFLNKVISKITSGSANDGGDVSM